MRTHNDVFVLQLLVFARQHGDDVMGGALLFLGLAIGEVMIVTYLLLALDDGLELQTTQLTDDIFRGEGIAHCGWESATQLLRCQVFHRLLHGILLLRIDR